MDNLEKFILYEKIYDDEIIDNAVNNIMSLPWDRKLDYTANYSKHISRNGNRNIVDYSDIDSENFKFDADLILREYVNNLPEQYKWHIKCLFNTQYIPDRKIVKYNIDDEYDWHIDLRIHQNKMRLLSSITYLNDNYEGGETELIGKVIQPKKNYTLIFPSTWLFPHRGLPIISGEKYIYVCHYWIVE